MQLFTAQLYNNERSQFIDNVQRKIYTGTVWFGFCWFGLGLF